MSHEIVKSIIMRGGKVFVNSADSSIRPLDFNTWEAERLSKMLQEEGRTAVLAAIGENVFNGNWRLYQGNKLTRLFLRAMEPIQAYGIHFTNFDSQAVGKYLAEAVQKLEENLGASLKGDMLKLLELRCDKEHILDAAKRTGHSFLNYADVSLQKDRELAMEITRICGDRAWFELPDFFQEDRELVMEAVKRNGCNYRQLRADSPLRADKEIIMTAFEDLPGRIFHEHLPRLIPVEALTRDGRRSTDNLDAEFMLELLEKCPSMHLDGCPWILQDRDVALKWCEVGKSFPYSMSFLPQRFVSDLEFQDVLVRRFEGTEKYDVLVKKFEERGIAISSVGALLADANCRAEKQGVERSIEEIGK